VASGFVEKAMLTTAAQKFLPAAAHVQAKGPTLAGD
jgi:hypothetical protein